MKYKVAAPVLVAAALSAVSVAGAENLPSATPGGTPIDSGVQDIEILKATDLAVHTHKWEGRLVQTTLNCFYADKYDYRCYDTKSFARVRVDFQTFDSDGEAFLQKRCDRAEIADTSACLVTIVFIYQSFDVMPLGGFVGNITMVKPEHLTGFVLQHGTRSAASDEERRKARHFLAQGSIYIFDNDDHKSEQVTSADAAPRSENSTGKDCSNIKPENRTLDCALTGGTNVASSGLSSSPHKSCDTYERIQKNILDDVNRDFEKKGVGIRFVEASDWSVAAS